MAALCLLLQGCGDRIGHTTGTPPTIVVSTTHLRDLVGSIGGEAVNVVTLIDGTADPHGYQPTPSDVARLRRADAVFLIGGGLEGKLEHALSGVEARGAAVVRLAEADHRDHGDGEDHGHGHDHPDAHIWFSFDEWSESATRVAGVLAEIDPGHAEAFRQRAASYREEIAEVRKYARRQAKRIPEESRILATGHDAFGLLAEELGLRTVSLRGRSTAAEPGLGDVRILSNFLKEHPSLPVFADSQAAAPVIRSVAEAVGNPFGGTLHSGTLGLKGGLHTDAEGREHRLDTWAGTLIRNIDTIVEALGSKNDVEITSQM